MTRRNLFLLRFNGRNDNLGDQFIFRALADALSPLGVVRLRGRVPDFVADAPSPLSDWKLGLLTALMKLRGYSIYNVQPPGGRLWTQTNRNNESARRWLRRSLFDLFAGSRIALGTSVIPAADHSWCDWVDWIGVRDRASLAALRAAGVNHADYFPDLAFLVPPRIQGGAERRGAVFSFRNTIPEAGNDRPYESRLSEAIGVLTRSLTAEPRNSAKLYHQVDEDAEFNDRLSTVTSVLRHGPKLTLASLESFYQSAQIVVSNRLHCLLLGAYCGAVPIALTSREHTKVAALFETVGWKSLILLIDDLDGLVSEFAAIQKDLPSFRTLVESTFEHQRHLGLETLERIFGAHNR